MISNCKLDQLPNGDLRKVHYISGGNGLAAIFVDEGSNSTFYYAYTDYLGSLTTLTDDTGTVVERHSFDAWGNRRNTNDWRLRISSAGNYITDRGFTMHEHLDDFALINMNGRVYDPVIARFLSPDPQLQAPGYWLNFNRYAYAYNNPLIYTDPDGEWIIQALAVLAFTYFKTAYDNRDKETGKWAWNLLDWFKDDDFRFEVSVSTNTNMDNFNVTTSVNGVKFFDSDQFKEVKDPADNVDKAVDNAPKKEAENRREAANGGGYYPEGSYSYDKRHIQYLPAEGIALLGGWSNVRGNAKVYRGSDGKYYANVSATGYTPASTKGTVNFSGSVDVLSGNKVISSHSLHPFSGPSIIQSGRQDVGSAVFALPNVNNDVYLRFNVGYSYSEGVGYAVPIPRQGHYNIQIGFTIDAWTY